MALEAEATASAICGIAGDDRATRRSRGAKVVLEGRCDIADSLAIRHSDVDRGDEADDDGDGVSVAAAADRGGLKEAQQLRGIGRRERGQVEGDF